MPVAFRLHVKTETTVAELPGPIAHAGRIGRGMAFIEQRLEAIPPESPRALFFQTFFRRRQAAFSLKPISRGDANHHPRDRDDDSPISQTLMSENSLNLNPAATAPSAGPERLVFEICFLTYGDGLTDSGDREVIDVCEQHSATIVPPQAGKFIQDYVLRWREEHEGRFFAILRTDPPYYALRTDVALSSPHRL